MSRSVRTSSMTRRDAGLRRLRALNRVLIGAAVAGTGLLTDVAAHAFPGHKRHVTAEPARTVAARPAGAGTSATHHRHHRRRHRARPALAHPATPPTTTTTTTRAAAPAPVTTQATQAAPQITTTSAPAQPAPVTSQAPVTSGGS